MTTYSVQILGESPYIVRENAGQQPELHALIFSNGNPHALRDAEIMCDALNLFEEKGAKFNIAAVIAEQVN